MTPEDKKQLADMRMKLYSDDRMSMDELAELIRLLESEHYEKRQNLPPPPPLTTN